MTDEKEILNDEIKNDEPKKETIQNIIPFWSDNPNILLKTMIGNLN